MHFSLPTIQQLPSVHAALKWLLAERISAEEDILATAQKEGLIDSETGAHWNANSEMVAQLSAAALQRAFSDPERFGEVLHGIGELAARCHASSISNLFVDYLAAHGQGISLSTVLDTAAQTDSTIPRQAGFDELALGQWITQAKLSWETLDAAVSLIDHPTRALGRFGLSFVIRIVLRVEPSVIDNWINSHPEHPTISVVGSAALAMVFPFDERADVSSLLGSGTPAIKSLGAAALVRPIGLESKLSFRDCHKALVAAGFAPADAIWMTGLRIKNAVHARYRIEHAREQHNARQQYLEQNPDKAMGDIRNAKAEIKMLRNQLSHAEESYSKLLPELEDMLCDMAADWPVAGLSDEQMKSLEHIFVDTAEIRYRLAAKLSHQASRDWLLQRNITRLQDFIGLKKNPDDIPTDYLLPTEEHFLAIANWASQSLILRYESDNRGIGKRTSDLVSGVAQAAAKLWVQPFISARRPEIWQAVLTRAACAGRFAFAVVVHTPEHERHKVTQLNELALNHAFDVLSACSLPISSISPFHQLSAQAVHHLAFASNPDALREKWALAEELPDFVRALVL
jgi:hypothetical protein